MSIIPSSSAFPSPPCIRTLSVCNKGGCLLHAARHMGVQGHTSEACFNFTPSVWVLGSPATRCKAAACSSSSPANVFLSCSACCAACTDAWACRLACWASC